MTKTHARHVARRHLRFGYYTDDGRDRWVYCPFCKLRIDSPHEPLDKRTPDALLRDRLVEHLTKWCDYGIAERAIRDNGHSHLYWPPQ